MTSRFLLSVLVLSAPLLFTACDHVTEAKAASAEPVTHVDTIEPQARTIPRTVRITATVEANRSADVAADSSGKVVSTFVERGTFVKKGTALVRLDATNLSLSASQAKADEEGARADAVLRQSEWERAEKLYARGAISSAELDRARAAKDSADQRASSATARHALSSKQTADTVIRAPFDGIVAERWVDEGEYVRADTKIVTLVDASTLRLALVVPEEHANAVHEGDAIAFHIPSDPARSYGAHIRFASPQIRKQTRDLVVEAVIDETNESLKPGMFAVADLGIGSEKVFAVPTQTLRNNHAFVVTNGRLEERVVQIQGTEGNETLVLDGLHPGERLVAAPTDQMKDGLRVD